MNKEEKRFCERCISHENCCFVPRGSEYNCVYVNVFSQGYEAATDKAIAWLRSNIDCRDWLLELRKYLEE